MGLSKSGFQDHLRTVVCDFTFLTSVPASSNTTEVKDVQCSRVSSLIPGAKEAQVKARGTAWVFCGSYAFMKIFVKCGLLEWMSISYFSHFPHRLSALKRPPLRQSKNGLQDHFYTVLQLIMRNIIWQDAADTCLFAWTYNMNTTQHIRGYFVRGGHRSIIQINFIQTEGVTCVYIRHDIIMQEKKITIVNV